MFSETVSRFSPNLRSPEDFHCLHRRAPAPALTTLSRVCFSVVAFGGMARYNDFFFVFLETSLKLDRGATMFYIAVTVVVGKMQTQMHVP